MFYIDILPSPNLHLTTTAPRGNVFSPDKSTKPFCWALWTGRICLSLKVLLSFCVRKTKDVDIVCETKPHLNVQNPKETAKNNLEIRSQDKNLPMTSSPVCQTNTDNFLLQLSFSLPLTALHLINFVSDWLLLLHPRTKLNHQIDRLWFIFVLSVRRLYCFFKFKLFIE